MALAGARHVSNAAQRRCAGLCGATRPIHPVGCAPSANLLMKLRCMGDGIACARCEGSGLICEDAPTKRRRTGNGSRVTPSSRTGETTKSAATVSENGVGESLAHVASFPGAVPNISERLPDVSNTDSSTSTNASAAHLVAPSSIPQPPQLHVPNESHPNDWDTFMAPSC